MGSRWRLALPALAVLGGCSHGTPAPVAPTQVIERPAEAEPMRSREDGLEVSGLTGTISEDEVEDAFKRSRPAIDDCYRKAVAQVPWLGGNLSLKARVGKGGVIKEAFATEPLGNLEAERCMLDVVKAMHMSEPQGGPQAEFSESFEFRGTVQLQQWGNDEVSKVFVAHQRALDECAAHVHAIDAPKAVRVVFLVGPGGMAASAGVGADSPLDGDYASCLVAAVRKWKFPDPRGKVARVTYSF